jgi:hypothetical protein
MDWLKSLFGGSKLPMSDQVLDECIQMVRSGQPYELQRLQAAQQVLVNQLSGNSNTPMAPSVPKQHQ